MVVWQFTRGLPQCGILPRMRRASFIQISVALALAVFPPSPAGAKVPANQLQVVELRPLRFGLIAQSAQSGIIRVTPDGRQICLNIQCLGGAQSGLYAVNGASDLAIQVTVSTTALGNTTGTGSFSFTPRLANGTLIVPTGIARGQFTVGGDLRIGANADAGVYLGDFQVIIEYQ